AGTSRGVFKSTDGGNSWSDVTSGLASANVGALAVDPKTPSTLYAGTPRGVFKSVDGGDRWAAVNTGLTGLDVRALAIDPAMPTTVLAATADGGFVLDQSSTAPVAPGELTARLTGTRSRAAAQRP